jgi:5-methylcytosine-specific restriction endonuclease McrA
MGHYDSAEYKKNRLITLKAANYICHYCGLPATTADHLTPISSGYIDHSLSNLVAACLQCNGTRQDRDRVRLRYFNRRYM